MNRSQKVRLSLGVACSAFLLGGFYGFDSSRIEVPLLDSGAFLLAIALVTVIGLHAVTSERKE